MTNGGAKEHVEAKTAANKGKPAVPKKPTPTSAKTSG